MYAVLGTGLWLLTLSAGAQNSVRDSLVHASDVLEYHPDSVDLRLRRAAWNMQLEQWEYAKDDYDKILAQQPGNVAALFFRAYTNEKLGRYAFARLDYENLLQIVPTHYEAKLGLALLNQKDRHLTEAMDQINSLVEQCPDSASAWAARAGMENGRGMADAAEYDYSEALRREPDNVDFLLAHASLCVDMGLKAKAEADIERLLKLGATTPELQMLRRRLRQK